MAKKRWNPPLVATALPELAEELVRNLDAMIVDPDEEYGIDKQLLRRLKDQIPTLKILSVCPCGDDFCGSFSTGERDRERFEGDIILPEDSLILEVCDGRIVYVEVLFRPELRTQIRTAFFGHN